jgi:glycosyltransferase involved in cell wall biosynthesis
VFLLLVDGGMIPVSPVLRVGVGILVGRPGKKISAFLQFSGDAADGNEAFEAMAMGCPVVSTAIGTERLGAEQDVHYLERGDPAAMADAVLALLNDAPVRNGLAQRALA